MKAKEYICYDNRTDDVLAIGTAKECDFEKLCNSQAKEYIDTLQELVDRDTPKKPIKDEPSKIRYIPTYVCPICGQRFSRIISKYCYNCGQALDWSD